MGARPGPLGRFSSLGVRPRRAPRTPKTLDHLILPADGSSDQCFSAMDPKGSIYIEVRFLTGEGVPDPASSKIPQVLDEAEDREIDDGVRGITRFRRCRSFFQL